MVEQVFVYLEVANVVLVDTAKPLPAVSRSLVGGDEFELGAVLEVDFNRECVIFKCHWHSAFLVLPVPSVEAAHEV